MSGREEGRERGWEERGDGMRQENGQTNVISITSSK